MALTNLDKAIAQVEENNHQLTGLLKSSIAKEENERLRNQQMSKRIVHLEAQVRTMADLLRTELDEKEAQWDNDETFVSPEAARDYLDRAIFMRTHFGRKNNRIDAVQRWYDNYLPFGNAMR